MNLGLHVEFDGKKNTVLEGEFIKEYPIGGMICEYARFSPSEIKQFILENTFYNETDVETNLTDAVFSLHTVLKQKYGAVVATTVIIDFSNTFADFNRMSEAERNDAIAGENKDKENDKIKKYILKDSGYDSFGMSTIGQALLTAYSMYAQQYVVFKYMFEIFTSEREAEENQIDAFFSLYAENVDFQHIEFAVMLYDGKFHSIYTIQSSISLFLFEAANAINADVSFKKCKNCGNYFVPVGRADILYCSYPSPQNRNKACRDIGAQVTSTKKMKNDLVEQEYRRLYMRLKMASRRHPEDADIKERLDELASEMKKRRTKRSAKEISSDDILEWLHSMDEKI